MPCETRQKNKTGSFFLLFTLIFIVSEKKSIFTFLLPTFCHILHTTRFSGCTWEKPQIEHQKSAFLFRRQIASEGASTHATLRKTPTNFLLQLQSTRSWHCVWKSLKMSLFTHWGKNQLFIHELPRIWYLKNVNFVKNEALKMRILWKMIF